MSKNAQRLSQVVSTFGPGAMIDLPTRSVVVGLELWDTRGGTFSNIAEPNGFAHHYVGTRLAASSLARWR